MYTDVYVDVLFLIDFSMDAVSLFLCARLCALPIRFWKICLGAVIGAGLVKGIKNVNFGVFKNIAIAWISSPTVAGLLTYLVALATQNYFA